MNRFPSHSGPWLILAAAVLWGTTGTAQALIPGGAPPAALGAARLAVGGLAFLALAGLSGALPQARRLPLLPTLLAAACMAAYQPAFFEAVRRTGVAAGTLVAIGSAPVLAGALGWLLYRERPGRRWFAATALALAGCALLAAAGQQVQIQRSGLLLALLAGLSYALYSVIAKKLLQDVAPDAAMAVIFSLAALLLLPVFFFADLRWLARPSGLAAALYLGLLPTVAGYALFSRGLRQTSAAVAVTLSLAEPLTAGLLGVFLLGESLAALAWLGVGLLFAGLAMLAI